MTSKPPVLTGCRTVSEVAREMGDPRSPKMDIILPVDLNRLTSLFRGATDSLMDYRAESCRTIRELSDRSRRGEHAVDSLRRIRDIGYGSTADRATETVLACIRIAEEAIREYEMSTERKQDEDVHS